MLISPTVNNVYPKAFEITKELGLDKLGINLTGTLNIPTSANI